MNEFFNCTWISKDAIAKCNILPKELVYHFSIELSSKCSMSVVIGEVVFFYTNATFRRAIKIIHACIWPNL
jgi:hypothetical protein